MLNKKEKRLRRCKKTRILYKKNNKISLVIYKTSRHIYAQIIKYNNNFSYTLISASTLEKKNIDNNIYTGNKISASVIGKIIARRAIIKGIKNIVFDRSGYKYHGRIKILVESARKHGLFF